MGGRRREDMDELSQGEVFWARLPNAPGEPGAEIHDREIRSVARRRSRN